MGLTNSLPISGRLYDEGFIRWAKVVNALQIAKDGSILLIETTMRQFAKGLEPATDRKHVLKYIHDDRSECRCDVKNCIQCVGISDRIRTQINGEYDKKRKKKKEEHDWKREEKEEEYDGSKKVLVKCKETRPNLTEEDIWWEVCKIYINDPDRRIRDSAGPNDVDLQAILRLLMKCKLFDRHSSYALSKKISISVLANKLNDIRNNAMHSFDNKFSEQTMNDAFTSIEYFIEEIKNINMEKNNMYMYQRVLVELSELKRQLVKEELDDLIIKALNLKKEHLHREIQEGKAAGKSVETYEAMLQHTIDYIDRIRETKNHKREMDQLQRREEENKINRRLKDEEVERLKEENRRLQEEVERLNLELRYRNVEVVQPQQQREAGGLSHTATGAVAGATAGAALGPVGAAVGGTIGGMFGFVRDLAR